MTVYKTPTQILKEIAGYIRRDYSGNLVVSTDFDMNANTVTNLAAPSASSDAATKTYVDTSITESRKEKITIFLDGQGDVLATGAKAAYVSIPWDATLTKWRILCSDGVNGSVTIDLWKDTYTNFPPVDGDSICGGATPGIKPYVSSAQKNEGTDFTSWTTTTFTTGDVLEVEVESVTDVTRLTLELFFTVDVS